MRLRRQILGKKYCI